jgi:hypothetical protein
MSRLGKLDATLGEMNDERAHLAIQISLLADAQVPDAPALNALRLEMDNLDRRIARHRPGGAFARE